MINIKVYFQVNDKETSFMFESKEFGCVEYFDDTWSTRYKNVKEAILSSYISPSGHSFKTLKEFRESNYGKIIYLGEL